MNYQDVDLRERRKNTHLIQEYTGINPTYLFDSPQGFAALIKAAEKIADIKIGDSPVNVQITVGGGCYITAMESMDEILCIEKESPDTQKAVFAAVYEFCEMFTEIEKGGEG